MEARSKHFVDFAGTGRNKTGAHRIVSVCGGIAPPSRRRAPHLEWRSVKRSLAVAAGLAIRAIARSLGRSPSTICREIARNGGAIGCRRCCDDQLNSSPHHGHSHFNHAKAAFGPEPDCLHSGNENAKSDWNLRGTQLAPHAKRVGSRREGDREGVSPPLASMNAMISSRPSRRRISVNTKGRLPRCLAASLCMISRSAPT
jgi:hypothetical protein